MPSLNETKQRTTTGNTKGCSLNEMTPFKKSGNALTKVLGRPLSGEFNLKCGTLAGVAIGAAINPWAIPQAAIAGFGVGAIFSVFIDSPAVKAARKEKARLEGKAEDYELGERLQISLFFLGLFACATGITHLTTDYLYSRHSDEGQAQRAAQIQQKQQIEDQKKAAKAKAMEDAWIAAQQGKGPHTVQLTNGDSFTFKNMTFTPQTLAGEQACQIEWTDPNRNDQQIKALVLKKCSDIATPKK